MPQGFTSSKTQEHTTLTNYSTQSLGLVLRVLHYTLLLSAKCFINGSCKPEEPSKKSNKHVWIPICCFGALVDAACVTLPDVHLYRRPYVWRMRVQSMLSCTKPIRNKTQKASGIPVSPAWRRVICILFRLFVDQTWCLHTFGLERSQSASGTVSNTALAGCWKYQKLAQPILNKLNKHDTLEWAVSTYQHQCILC